VKLDKPKTPSGKRFAKLGFSSVLFIDGAVVNEGFAARRATCPASTYCRSKAPCLRHPARDMLVLTRDALTQTGGAPEMSDAKKKTKHTRRATRRISFTA